jgi:hypothetical protein
MSAVDTWPLTQSGQAVFFRLNMIKHLIPKQKGRAELPTD